jgi:transposase-like protein
VKAKEFQSLVEHLSELTAAQRGALEAALRSRDPATDVIALIEARFAAAPACGHCRSERIGPWGSAAGLKRYRCKDCRRTFNALTGTPLAQLHKRDAWLNYARALVDRVSLRKAAARCGVDLTTAFRWRHRFLEASREAKPAKVEGIVEADETFFLRSAKGSKKLFGRAPRKRGTKAKKPGTSSDYVPVLIVRDRHGATTDAVLPGLGGSIVKTFLKPVVAADALLVSDGAKVYGGFAKEIGIAHKAVIATRGEHVVEGVYHLQNVNAYMSRLKGWLRPFNGVATKYLNSYLGWRRMIEREGDNLTPRRSITCALY